MAKAPDERKLISVYNLPLPQLEYVDRTGNRDLDKFRGHPLLVNLWASWCLPCAKELKEMGMRADALRDAGVQVLALSVDDLAPDASSSENDPGELLKRLRFPFDSGRATNQLVSKLQLVNDTLFDSHRPLPVPTSLLIDDRGWLVAIAKGPIGVEEILTAVRRLPGPGQESPLAASVLPFDGRWAAELNSGGLDRVLVNRLVEQNLLNDAALYVEQASDRLEKEPGYIPLLNQLASIFGQREDYEHALEMLQRAVRAQPEDATLHSNLGWALLTRGLANEAEGEFQRALEIDAGLAMAHAGTAEIFSSRGETAAAERGYLEALRFDPQLVNAYGRLLALYEKQNRMDDAITIFEQAFARGVEADGMHYRMSQCLLRVGREAEAIEHLDDELVRNPDHVQALNNLARILATHPDSALRDGKRAVELAQRAVTGRGEKNPYSHGALATALAETGQFDEALNVVKQALTLARAAQRDALVKQLESEQQFYQSSTPARMR